jgi:tRNA A37 threonylcarbamoyladenosine dehydratase
MRTPQEHIRTAMLVGEDALTRYRAARVAVFGVGGVGGYVCEGLARAGIGALDLFDHDTVSLSNINRQIIALHSTVGQNKVDVMAARIADINPDCCVGRYPIFYLPENADEIDLSRYDYIVDAIDTVSAKIELAVRAHTLGIPIIASMGTGNKLDPFAFRIADISKTDTCPLAKVMRRELRARGIHHMKVLFSKELPRRPISLEGSAEENRGGKVSPASIATVPSVAGLMIANEILRDLGAVTP